MDLMSLAANASNPDTAELDELRSAILSRIQMMDEDEDASGLAVYINAARKGLIIQVKQGYTEGDIDKLRMFAKVEAPIQSFRFAEHARANLRELGLGMDAVTPQALTAYTQVVQARADLLESARVWSHGNAGLLKLLIEEPSTAPVLIHLIDTLRISDVDELVSKAREYVGQGFSDPLLNGTL